VEVSQLLGTGSFKRAVLVLSGSKSQKLWLCLNYNYDSSIPSPSSPHTWLS